MTDTLYDITDLRRVYRRGGVEVRAVDRVDLQIGAGELVAIEGASGSGKSTLLQLLGGLDRPTSGSITFDGADLGGLTDAELTDLRARQIGFVFQHFNLIPTLTALQNVESAMGPLRLSRSAQRTRAGALLDQVGLAARSDHLPSTMSGGEQQRVAIARALANGPRVLLADEPTGNLDSGTAAGVVRLLRALTDDLGVTVVLVTHAPDVAAQAARRIVMRDGAVVSDRGLRRLRVVRAGAARPVPVAAGEPVRVAAARPAPAADRLTVLIGRAAAAVALTGIAAVALHGAASLHGSSALRNAAALHGTGGRSTQDLSGTADARDTAGPRSPAAAPAATPGPAAAPPRQPAAPANGSVAAPRAAAAGRGPSASGSASQPGAQPASVTSAGVPARLLSHPVPQRSASRPAAAPRIAAPRPVQAPSTPPATPAPAAPPAPVAPAAPVAAPAGTPVNAWFSPWTWAGWSPVAPGSGG